MRIFLQFILLILLSANNAFAECTTWEEYSCSNHESADEDCRSPCVNGYQKKDCKNKFKTLNEKTEMWYSGTNEITVERTYCWTRKLTNWNIFSSGSYGACNDSFTSDDYYYRFNVDINDASNELGQIKILRSCGNGCGIWGDHICLEYVEDGDDMKMGDTNNSGLDKICAYIVMDASHAPVENKCDKYNPLINWCHAFIGCVDVEPPPGPSPFNPTLLNVIEPYIQLETSVETLINSYGSTFDQPVISFAFGADDYALRYKFDGDTSNVCDSCTEPTCQTLDGIEYCAYVNSDSPSEVCLCEGSSCSGDETLGCLPRPTPSESNIKIVTEYWPIEKSYNDYYVPALRAFYVRTFSTGDIKYTDGSGNYYKLDDDDNYYLYSGDTFSTSPATGSVIDTLTYDYLALSNPDLDTSYGNQLATEYYKSLISSGYYSMVTDSPKYNGNDLYSISLKSIVPELNSSFGLTLDYTSAAFSQNYLAINTDITCSSGICNVYEVKSSSSSDDGSIGYISHATGELGRNRDEDLRTCSGTEDMTICYTTDCCIENCDSVNSESDKDIIKKSLCPGVYQVPSAVITGLYFADNSAIGDCPFSNNIDCMFRAYAKDSGGTWGGATYYDYPYDASYITMHLNDSCVTSFYADRRFCFYNSDYYGCILDRINASELTCLREYIFDNYSYDPCSDDDTFFECVNNINWFFYGSEDELVFAENSSVGSTCPFSNEVDCILRAYGIENSMGFSSTNSTSTYPKTFYEESQECVTQSEYDSALALAKQNAYNSTYNSVYNSTYSEAYQNAYTSWSCAYCYAKFWGIGSCLDSCAKNKATSEATSAAQSAATDAKNAVTSVDLEVCNEHDDCIEEFYDDRYQCFSNSDYKYCMYDRDVSTSTLSCFTSHIQDTYGYDLCKSYDDYFSCVKKIYYFYYKDEAPSLGDEPSSSDLSTDDYICLSSDTTWDGFFDGHTFNDLCKEIKKIY